MKEANENTFPFSLAINAYFDSIIRKKEKEETLEEFFI